MQVSKGEIVFLLYSPRSGSTFLANSLTEEYNIVIPPEGNFLMYILVRPFFGFLPFWLRKKVLLKIIQRDHKFADWKLSPGEIEAQLTPSDVTSRSAFLLKIIQLYVSRQVPAGHRATDYAFCIKKGSYRKNIPLLRQHFPAAKYLLLVRDGRAVYNSQKKNVLTRTGKPFAESVAGAAREWRDGLENFAKLRADDPDRTLLVRYENLVSDLPAVLGRISAFLGLQRGDGTHYDVPAKYDTLHKNIDAAPKHHFADKWRTELEPEEIAAFQAVAGDTLAAWGYELAGAAEHR